MILEFHGTRFEISDTPDSSWPVLADFLDDNDDCDLAYAFRWCAAHNKCPEFQGRYCKIRWWWYFKEDKNNIHCLPYAMSINFRRAYAELFIDVMIELSNVLAVMREICSLEIHNISLDTST